MISARTAREIRLLPQGRGQLTFDSNSFIVDWANQRTRIFVWDEDPGRTVVSREFTGGIAEGRATIRV